METPSVSRASLTKRASKDTLLVCSSQPVGYCIAKPKSSLWYVDIGPNGLCIREDSGDGWASFEETVSKDGNSGASVSGLPSIVIERIK